MNIKQRERERERENLRMIILDNLDFDIKVTLTLFWDNITKFRYRVLPFFVRCLGMVYCQWTKNWLNFGQGGVIKSATSRAS